MELTLVEELAQILSENPISEIEINRRGSRIHLKKGASIAVAEAPISVTDGEASHVVTPSSTAEVVDRSVLVASELVGTFHHANPPLRVGAVVSLNQAIGNIEAMKLMTEVQSPVAGQVAEVFIEDGEPVDYGRQLFRIMPTEAA